MNTSKTHDLPARLEGVRQRFDRWRGAHLVRSPFPDSLWAVAVKMARTYGMCRTARALRVDYYSLKRRVEQDSAAAGLHRGGAVATFLELPPPGDPGFAALPAAAGECTLELEDASGAKMRVHLKGFAAPDLAALSRSFWNPVR
jgi:hypothetical protein